ncbi:MAG TPA: PDZ domain-containing protein [Candidatus Synoicihabitans sp.]|nr:PDZ domain-containing protein [Candidatus Synoicihabitans sp.]
MARCTRWRTLCLGAFAALAFVAEGSVHAADLPALWAERVACVVAVEFTTEMELERQVTTAYGVIVDAEGTIILPAPAINPRMPPSQLRDFRVYRPGEPITEFAPASYLGQDAFTGWHFVRVAEGRREGLRPISDFVGGRGDQEPRVAEQVWGIGLRKKDEEFRPYFLSGQISMVQSLPQRTGIALAEVTGPGLPVFDAEGALLGIGAPGFGESIIIFSRRQRGGEPVVMVNPEECAAFRLTAEVLPYVDRVPKNVSGRPLAWLGVSGLQPVDPEVAQFLKLESRSGLVVSEVLSGSPARTAGLQERDIILAIDRQPLPRLKPDGVLPAFFERELERRTPGTTMVLGVLRGSEQQEIEVTLGDAPTLPREAERRYFERIGLTARQLVFADAIDRRADPETARGLVVHFVKPSSPAATAGLRSDDWIQQIDGVEVTDFVSASERLATIENDLERNEFVLLVGRGSETAVLRVKMN